MKEIKYKHHGPITGEGGVEGHGAPHFLPRKAILKIFKLFFHEFLSIWFETGRKIANNFHPLKIQKFSQSPNHGGQRQFTPIFCPLTLPLKQEAMITQVKFGQPNSKNKTILRITKELWKCLTRLADKNLKH